LSGNGIFDSRSRDIAVIWGEHSRLSAVFILRIVCNQPETATRFYCHINTMQFFLENVVPLSVVIDVSAETTDNTVFVERLRGLWRALLFLSKNAIQLHEK
jgi:hypothetical protein